MTQVIGSELRFEAVLRLALRTGHHAGICDDRVEGFAAREQLVGRLAHTRERCEIRLDQVDTRAARRECFLERTVRLVQIPRRTNDGGAMRGERARSLNAQARGGAGHKYSLARKVDALEDFVSRRFRSESLCHCAAP